MDADTMRGVASMLDLDGLYRAIREIRGQGREPTYIEIETPIEMSL